MLRQAGCDVVGEADSEFAAARWLTQHRGHWDLAVIDLGLDMGSGWNSVLRFVQDGSGDVVVYTAYVSPSVRETGRLLGARATISKSFPDELRELVRAIILR